MEIAAFVVSFIAVAVAGLGMVWSLRQSRESNRIARKALSISERTEQVERAKAEADLRVSVVPVRLDNNGDLLFEIAGVHPARNVRIEAAGYGGERGATTFSVMMPGERRIRWNELSEECSLPTPQAATWLVTAEWDHTVNPSARIESGVYIASKPARRFLRDPGRDQEMRVR